MVQKWGHAIVHLKKIIGPPQIDWAIMYLGERRENEFISTYLPKRSWVKGTYELKIKHLF